MKPSKPPGLSAEDVAVNEAKQDSRAEPDIILDDGDWPWPELDWREMGRP